MRISYISKVVVLFVSIFFISNVLFAATPPGLSKSNKIPSGLENKTPAGWSKGKKKGWYKTPNKKIKIRKKIKVPTPRIKAKVDVR